MKVVAVILGLVCASPGVRAAAFGGEGGDVLTGSDETVRRGVPLAPQTGPKGWNCTHWQKIQEAKGNGPMAPCDESESEYCVRPEFLCDISKSQIGERCGASDGNEQRSENSCGDGDVHCRDVTECMCGGVSKTCVKKTCVSFQKENCPNSMVGGGVCKDEAACDVKGFKCDLEKQTFECDAAGRTRKPDAKPKDDESDKSAGDAVRTPLSLTYVVGLAAVIASAVNRM